MQSRNVLQGATRVRDPRENWCPICDGPAIKQCSCYHKDSCCANGHSWHTCIVHRRIVARKLPDHGMIGCTCEVVKVPVP